MTTLECDEVVGAITDMYVHEYMAGTKKKKRLERDYYVVVDDIYEFEILESEYNSVYEGDSVNLNVYKEDGDFYAVYWVMPDGSTDKGKIKETQDEN